jgi:hypothetical protein
VSDEPERDRELAELRELAGGGQQGWRFARSIPQWPHYYIVRSPENEAFFVRLFQAVKAYGQDQKFGPFRNRYLHLGDGWKYWVMDARVQDATIINRDQQLDPATFKRAEVPAASGHARGPRRRPG